MHKILIATAAALTLTTAGAAAQTAPGPSRGGPATAATAAAPSVEKLMNRTVVGQDGERIGKVTDVILGPDGQAQLIVVHSGSFLGIGGKDIAADIRLAEIDLGEESIRLRDVTQASVRDMPEFRYDDSMTSLNRSPLGGRTKQ